MTKFICIQTPDCVFIGNSAYLPETNGHSYCQNDQFTGAYPRLINGQTPEPTNRKFWYKIKELPRSYGYWEKESVKTVAWNLKEGYPPSEKLPARITVEEINKLFPCDIDGYTKFPYSLYEEERAVTPRQFKEEEFEYSIVAERDSKWEPVNPPFPVVQNLLDVLNAPIGTLQELPSKLEPAVSYALIRAHVQKHIDPKRAKITSDYDFHFAVSKIIKHKPEPFTYDANAVHNMFSKRKRRSKYVKDYRRERAVSVLDIAPKKDERWGQLAPSFEGKDYADLQDKFNDYLEGLMEEINRPLKDCECCKGVGVIIDHETF